jgi:peptidoglycan/LPS O-acetylase OafA/YrhL
MRSTNVGYMPRLDHLRLLAALLVFAFHFYHHVAGGFQAHPKASWLAPVVEGHTGVTLFFVLSGFLFMTIALRGGDIAYGSFMRNRFLRIFPLYLVVFFVAISIGRDRFQGTDVIYLMFSNLSLPPMSWHFVTGAAWSISLEFTFYLVFPFLAASVREQGGGYLWRVLLILLVVKLAAYDISEKSTRMFYSTLIGRFDQFLVGMLAALAFDRWQGGLRRAGAWLLPLSIAVVWGALVWQARHASFFGPALKDPNWIWWPTAEAACWALVVVAYLSAGLRLPKRIDDGLAAGGEWSYSFYMWHALVIYTVHAWIGPFPFTGRPRLDLLLYGLLVLAACLAFARLSYMTIERPFLRMRGSYLRAH